MTNFRIGDQVRSKVTSQVLTVVGLGPPEGIVWYSMPNKNYLGEPMEGVYIGWIQADYLEDDNLERIPPPNSEPPAGG